MLLSECLCNIGSLHDNDRNIGFRSEIYHQFSFSENEGEKFNHRKLTTVQALSYLYDPERKHHSVEHHQKASFEKIKTQALPGILLVTGFGGMQIVCFTQISLNLVPLSTQEYYIAIVKTLNNNQAEFRNTNYILQSMITFGFLPHKPPKS